MAKRPDHMTPEERLTRIYSLERKLRDAEFRLTSAELDTKSAMSAWQAERAEVRRLEDIIVERYDALMAVVEKPDQ